MRVGSPVLVPYGPFLAWGEGAYAQRWAVGPALTPSENVAGRGRG
jgi:hypothetical protein